VGSPEDSHAIWHPPRALQIRSNFVICSNLVVQVEHLPILWVRFQRRHPPWKRVHHAIDNVEEHQVGSRHFTSDQVLAFSFNIAPNGQGKVSQEFGNAIRPHVKRFAFGFVNLVFIVQPR